MSGSGSSATRQLVLEPHPASASAARRWVRDELHRVGHEEFVPSAELATSELVTNSVLHAHTTVTVTFERRANRCRIGVHDLSPRSPAPVCVRAGQVWSSGRGLQILSSVANTWGVEEQPPGKQVWFEPRDSRDHSRHAPTCADSASAPPSERLDGRRAVLQHAPVSLLFQARQRLADLRREMLLITFTLDEPDAEPAVGDVPTRLVALAEAMEPMTTDLLPDALSADATAEDTVTFTCRLPEPTEQQAIQGWADLLDEADDYCRTERPA